MSLAWSRIARVEGASPDFALAYDPVSRRHIYFVTSWWTGVRPPKWSDVSETWAYDAAKDAWTRLKTSGSPTPGLVGARMVYDAKARRMILFGGFDGTRERYCDETWVYDPRAMAWEKRAPATSPPPRNFHEMVFDESAGKTILYGSDNPDAPDSSTWAYDCAKDEWARVGTQAGPRAVAYAAMCYMPDSGKSLFFGGVVPPDEEPSDETWTFCLSEGWKRLEPARRPSARAWSAIAYDPLAKRAWLYGGGPTRKEPSGELWYFDAATGNWSLSSLAP